MEISNKTVLVTGGTGSLGKKLVEKLLQGHAKVIVYSRDEGKQALLFGGMEGVNRVIGDVRDYTKLLMTMKRFKVDYVIHAAALKRIDDMEFYPDECIKTNIEGSENVARASSEAGVKKCVLVSTDKACQPVNVYGCSKFIAERLFTNYDHQPNNTIYASVRYGNVIASRGSFVPLFMEWIEEGKEIRVTSEEMTRFLFTLDDAVEAVLGALKVCQGGEVFVPTINSYTLPSCIEALGRMLGKETRTRVTGLRPGEKLHEDMLSEVELPFTYKVPNKNLLQIRSQYGNKVYEDYEKYNGPHFNSALWVKDDVEELIELIKKGLEC